MRLTTHLTRLGLFATATATALTLTPTAASGLTVTPPVDPPPLEAPSGKTVVVRLKVADATTVRVNARRGVWPATMLTRQGITPDANDIVVVKRNGRAQQGERRRLRNGDVVKVVNVTRHAVVRKVKVAPRTVKISTTDLKPGRRKVVFRGRPAVHRVQVKRTLHNGSIVDRKVVKRTVVRKGKPRRVLVGRKRYSVPGADGLNWAALARCESGGNPKAVNPAGYYGLYQFNVGTWRSVGGSGMPHHASAEQQTYRAKLLYKSRGRSPWPHCGRYL